MSHDPTVTAAIVTVVGAGGVAITSFFATAWSTRRTLSSSERTSQKALETSESATQATIQAAAQTAKDAAHTERAHALWLKQTEVYRQLVLFIDLYQSKFVKAISESSSFWDLGDELSQRWRELSADLTLYGSDEVYEASLNVVRCYEGMVSSARNSLRNVPADRMDLERARINEVAAKTLIGRVIEGGGVVRSLVRGETQSSD